MYKKYLLLSFSVFLTVAIILVNISIKQNNNIPVETTKIYDQNTTINKKPMYIIKSFDGHAAIFVPDNEIPIEVTRINIKTLRQADQKLISSGLDIYSEVELTKFFEDFGS